MLSVVYDAERDGSDLVILDATDFAGAPVADRHLAAACALWFPRQLGAGLTSQYGSSQRWSYCATPA